MITARKDGLAVLHLISLSLMSCFLLTLLGVLFTFQTDKLSEAEVPYFICFLAILTGLGLTYRKCRHHLPISRPWRASKALSIAAYQTFAVGGTLAMALYLFEHDSLSRSLIVSYIILNFFLLAAANLYLPKRILRASTPRNLSKRYLLIGGEEAVRSAQSWIAEENALETSFVGYLSASGQGAPVNGLAPLGDVTALRQTIQKHHVTHVIILEMINSQSWFNFIVRIVEGHGCRLVIKNPIEDFLNRRLHYFSSADRLFFTLQKEPLENPAARLIKRTLDISIALPVCLTVLPPLFLLVAFKQRKQAPGPILFKQRRYGRNMEPFHILKFRSMRHDTDTSAEAEKRRGLVQASKGDPRIYPFGAFLRRTSLDEFPQFLNVLTGQMSIVGPRPHPIALDQKYTGEIPAYTSRHYVKPGITGLAQCKGLRGETIATAQMSKRILEDVAYLESWNPVLDLTILLRTAIQVFRAPDTAY